MIINSFNLIMYHGNDVKRSRRSEVPNDGKFTRLGHLLRIKTRLVAWNNQFIIMCSQKW